MVREAEDSGLEGFEVEAAENIPGDRGEYARELIHLLKPNERMRVFTGTGHSETVENVT